MQAKKRMGNYGNCMLNAPPVLEDSMSLVLLVSLAALSMVDGVRHSTSVGTITTGSNKG